MGLIEAMIIPAFWYPGQDPLDLDLEIHNMIGRSLMVDRLVAGQYDVSDYLDLLSDQNLDAANIARQLTDDLWHYS